MNVWWLALDRGWTSYEEAKRRQVVCMGWPELGDLSAVVPLAASPHTQGRFELGLEQIAQSAPGGEAWRRQHLSRAQKGLWRLLQIQASDLIVALEGTRVCGVCQMPTSAVRGYWFDPQFHYAHCFARNVAWHDWRPTVMGLPPQAPAQGVQGAAQMHKARPQVLEAWRRLEAASQTAYEQAKEASPTGNARQDAAEIGRRARKLRG